MKNRKLIRTIYNITYAGELIESPDENEICLKAHLESAFYISIPKHEIKEIL